jgi:hypothetical protein
MKTNFIEINNFEYVPNIRLNIYCNEKETRIIDGVEWYRDVRHTKVVDTFSLFKKDIKQFYKREYELNYVNHPNIIIWDYYYCSVIEKCFNFYNTGRNMRVLVELFNCGMIDKTKIKDIKEYTTQYNFNFADNLRFDNCFSIPYLGVEKSELYFTFENFLNLDVYKFDSSIKNNIPTKTNHRPCDIFYFPDYILTRKITESEKIVILRNLFELKINQKKQKTCCQ